MAVSGPIFQIENLFSNACESVYIGSLDDCVQPHSSPHPQVHRSRYPSTSSPPPIPFPPSSVVVPGVYAFVSVRLPHRPAPSQQRLPELNDSLPRGKSDDCTTSNDHGLRIRSPDPPPSLRRVHLLRLRPAFVPLAVPQGLSRPAATGAGSGSGATAGSGASAECKPAATAAGPARPAQGFRE